MIYRLNRIALLSALRLGLLLGWLVALLPAAAVSWLTVAALQQVDAAFGRMAPYELSILGQPVASIDPLAWLGLADTAASVGSLAGQTGLFWTLTLGLTVAGGLGVALTAVLVCLCYNLLAALGGGLRVELQPHPPR